LFLQLRSRAYVAGGDYEDAVRDCTEIIRLEPTNGLARARRGLIYSRKGNFERALHDYREAAQLSPGDPHLWNSLAWLLATCPSDSVRNGKESVEAAKKACDPTHWEQVVYLDTLAAAYAEAGDFKQAIQFQGQALSKQVTAGERLKLEAHMELYRRGLPYHENGAQ